MAIAPTAVATATARLLKSCRPNSQRPSSSWKTTSTK
jgi:hypothetical protein